MPSPIDHSFFRPEWEADHDSPTQEISESENPTKNQSEAMQEAIEAYELMKKESAKKPILQKRMQEVQNAIADHMINVADTNILKIKKKHDEVVSEAESLEASRRRRISHNELIRACTALAAAFTEYGLDTEWAYVVRLDSREGITKWAINVGSSVAADRAQQAREKPKTGKGE